MRIREISARALKGRNFDRKLGRATIIAGPNDTGKTAIADAVRLALFGYLPNRKTGPAIFELSSATTLTVEADLEPEIADGPPKTIARRWAKKGQQVKASSTGTDELPQLPAVLLDANEYFGSGPTRRVDMVFELCDLGETKTITALEAMIAPAEVKIEQPPGPPMKVQIWIDYAIAELGEALKRANAEVKRFDGMAQGITTVALGDKTVDPAAIDAELTAAREELEKAIAEHAKLEQAAAAVTSKSRRKRELNERIAELNRLVGDEPLPTEPAAEIEQRLEAARQRVATLRAEHEQAVKAAGQAKGKLERLRVIGQKIAEQLRIADMASDAEARRNQIEAAIAELGTVDESTAAKAAEAARARVAEIVAQQNALDAERDKELARIRDLTTKGCCPTCGAKGGEWGQMLDEILDAKRAAWDEQGAAIAAAYEQAGQVKAAAEATHSEARLKCDELKRLQDSLATEKERQRSAHSAAVLIDSLQNEQNNIGPVSADAPVEPAELRAQCEALEAARQAITRLQADERRRGYREELEQIGTLDDEAGEAASRAELEIEEMRERIASIESKKKQAAAQLADSRRLQQAADEKATAAAKVEKIKAAQKALAKERDELVAAAFGPLLATANRFTAGIIPTPLEFRDGAIGRFNGASWVDLSAFGGTYTAAAYAGIQVALCAKSPARIAIVDELGRMDGENKARFVANVIDALNAGAIDQFIGIDVRPEDWSGGPTNGADALTVLTTASK